MKKINLTGNIFGCFTVQGQAENVGSKIKWLCVCTCGKQSTRYAAQLRKLPITCGGCSTIRERTMHGNTRNGTAPPEYWVRANMLRRCLDPQHPQYRLYGARGISVDEAWQQSYSNFIQDMGPRPSIKHSIERVDNNKGYSKVIVYGPPPNTSSK